MSDLISRQAAIDAIGEDADWCEAQGSDWQTERKERDFQILVGLPSAQPEQHYDEWCTDCKEYNHERHCCPRFNRVIRTTVKEMKRQEHGKWIPVSERMPENIETVIVTHRKGVSLAWYNGYYWERGASTDHRPIKTVTAWMPLPEPYQEKEHESNTA